MIYHGRYWSRGRWWDFEIMVDPESDRKERERVTTSMWRHRVKVDYPPGLLTEVRGALKRHPLTILELADALRQKRGLTLPKSHRDGVDEYAKTMRLYGYTPEQLYVALKEGGFTPEYREMESDGVHLRPVQWKAA